MRRGWQRSLSIALALVMCGWLVASAHHLHVSPEDLSTSHASHACEFCASLATGAPVSMPAAVQWVGRPVTPTLVVVSVAQANPFVASYRSRAPPSA